MAPRALRLRPPNPPLPISDQAQGISAQHLDLALRIIPPPPKQLLIVSSGKPSLSRPNNRFLEAGGIIGEEARLTRPRQSTPCEHPASLRQDSELNKLDCLTRFDELAYWLSRTRDLIASAETYGYPAFWEAFRKLRRKSRKAEFALVLALYQFQRN